MTETKEEYSFQRPIRSLLLVSFTLVSLTSIVQLGVNIFSLSRQLNSTFLACSSLGVLLMSSELIPLVLSALSLFFVIIGGMGLKKMSARLMLTFAILLLLTFVLGLTASITSLTLINNTNSIQMILINDFESYFQKSANPFYSDYFQINLKCCGLVNETDWSDLKSSFDMPCSCCIDQCTSTSSCKMNTNNVWTNNCLSQMIMYLQNNVVLNSAILIAHSVIAFVSSTISFIVYRKMFKQKKYLIENVTNKRLSERSKEKEMLKNVLRKKSVPERQIVSNNVSGGKNFVK